VRKVSPADNAPATGQHRPSVCQRTGGFDRESIRAANERLISVASLHPANYIKDLWGPLTIKSQHDEDERRPQD